MRAFALTFFTVGISICPQGKGNLSIQMRTNQKIRNPDQQILQAKRLETHGHKLEGNEMAGQYISSKISFLTVLMTFHQCFFPFKQSNAQARKRNNQGDNAEVSKNKRLVRKKKKWLIQWLCLCFILIGQSFGLAHMKKLCG